MRANVRDLGTMLRVYAGKVPDLRIPVKDFDHARELREAQARFKDREVIVQTSSYSGAITCKGRIVGLIAVVQLERDEDQPDLPAVIEGQETLG